MRLRFIRWGLYGVASFCLLVFPRLFMYDYGKLASGVAPSASVDFHALREAVTLMGVALGALLGIGLITLRHEGQNSPPRFERLLAWFLCGLALDGLVRWTIFWWLAHAAGHV